MSGTHKGEMKIAAGKNPIGLFTIRLLEGKSTLTDFE